MRLQIKWPFGSRKTLPNALYFPNEYMCQTCHKSDDRVGKYLLDECPWLKPELSEASVRLKLVVPELVRYGILTDSQARWYESQTVVCLGTKNPHQRLGMIAFALRLHRKPEENSREKDATSQASQDIGPDRAEPTGSQRPSTPPLSAAQDAFSNCLPAEHSGEFSIRLLGNDDASWNAPNGENGLDDPSSDTSSIVSSICQNSDSRPSTCTISSNLREFFPHDAVPGQVVPALEQVSDAATGVESNAVGSRLPLPSLVTTGLDAASTAGRKSSSSDTSPESGSDEEPIGWIRGNLIGKGSFGSVYLGMNPQNGTIMAVKQVALATQAGLSNNNGMHMHQIRSLEREIAILKELDHPNIVRYLGKFIFGTR